MILFKNFKIENGGERTKYKIIQKHILTQILKQCNKLISQELYIEVKM